MASSCFAELSGPARLALRVAAACLGLLIGLLVLDPASGAAFDAAPLHRWGVALAGALATATTIVRVAAIERDRRAWAPLALGLGLYTCGSLLWAMVWSGRPDPPLPSPADVLWL